MALNLQSVSAIKAEIKQVSITLKMWDLRESSSEGKHSAWLAACTFKTGEPEPLFMKLRGDDAMRKRNRTIAIRCTEEEYQRIHDKAEQYGLRLNDFVIRSALDKKIIVADGINEIVKQQKAIGRNLNQIATLANMDRLTAVNFQPLLNEHINVTTMIGELLRTVK